MVPSITTAFPDLGIGFGDEVKVKRTPLTEGLGLADLSGDVFGQTIPSSSGVDEIIGESGMDYAINVFFPERNEGFWFAPELLEPLHHSAGTEFHLIGVPKVWIRTEQGEWEERDVADGA